MYVACDKRNVTAESKSIPQILEMESMSTGVPNSSLYESAPTSARPARMTRFDVVDSDPAAYLNACMMPFNKNGEMIAINDAIFYDYAIKVGFHPPHYSHQCAGKNEDS